MTPVVGAYATATPCEILDTPEWSQTVCHWIIDSRRFHPFWTQWVLVCVRLDDVPEFPAPWRKFDGVTHEIILFAVHPDYPITAELMATPGFKVANLEPINFADQFTATDAEMRRVCELMARSICRGTHSPEPPFGYESFRRYWLTSIVKTLAHIRGEEHAP